MDNRTLYKTVSSNLSRNITRTYSTSFSLGISFLKKSIQKPIYEIYGFVRLADEIVDTFDDQNQEEILNEFREDTYKALERNFSINPVLHSFQEVVNEYNIDIELIDTFLDSMAMDLTDQKYDVKTYEKYILGSAEVVGLMCLKVFTLGDQKLYEELKFNAMKLGSAFQKINFLRDIKEDYENLERNYFPNVNIDNMTPADKKAIEDDIATDFELGYIGILKLPKKARFGVYLAYVYYQGLFKKIQGLPHQKIRTERVRIPDHGKYRLFVSSYVRHNIGLL